MPDVRKVAETVTAPIVVLHRAILSTVSSLRRQAPGARMVGEFVVKTGAQEAGRRIRGNQK